MPFVNKSQMRACFAKKDPNWDCRKWAHETKNIKKLPEKKEVKENNNPYKSICPECAEPACGSCRCTGPHSAEEIAKGHGVFCKNGHHWSREKGLQESKWSFSEWLKTNEAVDGEKKLKRWEKMNISPESKAARTANYAKSRQTRFAKRFG